MNFKELGEFSKQLQLIEYKRVYDISQLPDKNKKEIALIGKSNVGKSSLINTVLNHNITRSSKQPGCTKWIGYVELNNTVLIDLPGYGYANVSKERQKFWQKMILDYINSGRIDTVLLLIDARRGIQLMDQEVAMMFEAHQIKYIFTKSDEKKIPEHKNLKFSIYEEFDLKKIRQIIA